MIKNYYQVLGLKNDATPEEIKKAYRLYATKYHPDKQEGDEFFQERFIEIKEAYDILSDPIKRKGYDASYFKQQKQQYSEKTTSKPPQETYTRQQTYTTKKTYSTKQTYTAKQAQKHFDIIKEISLILTDRHIEDVKSKDLYMLSEIQSVYTEKKFYIGHFVLGLIMIGIALYILFNAPDQIFEFSAYLVLLAGFISMFVKIKVVTVHMKDGRSKSFQVRHGYAEKIVNQIKERIDYINKAL